MADRSTQAAAIDTALGTLSTDIAAWLAVGGASPALLADYLVSWLALQDQGIAARLHQGVSGALVGGSGKRTFVAADNVG